MFSRFKSKTKSECVERRSRQRHDWPLVVQCKKGSKLPGRTLDLSADSVRVITQQDLCPGDELTLELYLNESDIFSIRFDAQCIWSRKSGTDFVAGLDLSASKPRNLQLLREFVTQL